MHTILLIAEHFCSMRAQLLLQTRGELRLATARSKRERPATRFNVPDAYHNASMQASHSVVQRGRVAEAAKV
jgi:hypothetical protein